MEEDKEYSLNVRQKGSYRFLQQTAKLLNPPCNVKNNEIPISENANQSPPISQTPARQGQTSVGCNPDTADFISAVEDRNRQYARTVPEMRSQYNQSLLNKPTVSKPYRKLNGITTLYQAAKQLEFLASYKYVYNLTIRAPDGTYRTIKTLVQKPVLKPCSHDKATRLRMPELPPLTSTGCVDNNINQNCKNAERYPNQSSGVNNIIPIANGDPRTNGNVSINYDCASNRDDISNINNFPRDYSNMHMDHENARKYGVTPSNNVCTPINEGMNMINSISKTNETSHDNFLNYDPINVKYPLDNGYSRNENTRNSAYSSRNHECSRNDRTTEGLPRISPVFSKFNKVNYYNPLHMNINVNNPPHATPISATPAEYYEVTDNTTPDMVEDATEIIISQDGGYLEQCGIDVMKCILCSWVGAKITLEHHIRRTHSAEISTHALHACSTSSATYCLCSVPRAPSVSSRVLDLRGALFALSVSTYSPTGFRASLAMIAHEAEAKVASITVFNKLTREPYTWHGIVQQLTENYPFDIETCLDIDLQKTNQIPSNCDIDEINKQSDITSHTQVFSGPPDSVTDISITLLIKIY